MTKQFIALLMILAFSNIGHAQSDDYNKLWKQVEKFESQGLPKSALEIVEQISALSKSKGNSEQIVKTLLYKSKYALILEEDATLKVINDFKDEISKSEVPTKNILENLLANLYWQYFQQNRYRFYGRTTTDAKVDTTDFRTWDLKTLFHDIDMHFQNSLTDAKVLKEIPLQNYNALLLTAENSKLYRPTLFDFLNQNALDFYKTDENSISEPSYKFQIDDPQLLSSAAIFSKLQIVHRDSTALQFKTLKIYQDLISLHLQDKNPEALVSADIQRLQFVKNNATIANKEALFIETLKESAERYKTEQVSALYNYELAQTYYQQGQNYDPKTNREPRWKLKEAIALCNSVINTFPKSKGAETCEILKQTIQEPSMALVAENIIPIQKNSLLLLRYSNVNLLKFKIFKLSEAQRNTFEKTYRQKERFDFFKNLKVVQEWESNLRDGEDFQIHATEIVVPELENGTYVIVASPNFSNSEFFGYKTVQVTNLALTSKNDKSNTLFQIIDRRNGAPVIGAQVTVQYRKNHNSTSHTEKYQTDKNGEFRLKETEDSYYNLNITINSKNDTAYIKDYYDNRYYNDEDEDEEVEYASYLFTDRSIYRPGQVVYFKGIATKTFQKKTSLLTNKAAKLSLKNVNGEILKEINLETNEFGSVSGEFILPSDGLTGNYSIVMDTGSSSSTHFSVEEYKRPKFETKFDPISETFKINDSVKIQGKALAYAGSAISNANVVYRVYRKVQFPRWYFWYRPSFQSEPQEISHGEIMTDKDGNFEITFKALPDESVDNKNLPVFHYEVSADVTDINGETRGSSIVVNVGYHALIAKVTVDAHLDKTEKNHQIIIDTKNLNGEFVPATGTIKIYKLNAPEAVLRVRPWPAPDFPILSREAFKKLFPHEAYEDENRIETWDKGKLVFESKFDTGLSKIMDLGSIPNWEPGNYMVVLESKDKDGQEVKDQVPTYVYSPLDSQLPDHQLITMTTDNSVYKVRQNVLLTIASAADDLVVTVDIEKDNKNVKTYTVPLSNSKKTIAIPVLDTDLGGFAIHYSYAFENSFFTSTINISVPYPKSELSIETNTFRDKLEPGSKETWSFTVKGPQGEKVSAELLASMYDLSLDQFQPHEWQFSPLFQPTYYSYNQRNASQSFGTGRFQEYLPVSQLNYPVQNFDQWNWFGLHLGGNRYMTHMLRGKASGVQINASAAEMVEEESALEEMVVTGYATDQRDSKKQNETSNNAESTVDKENFDTVSIRKNLKETAFFFPKLHTDAKGNISFSFTTPEALTRWKLQLLAHTKTLQSATKSLEIVTQKELMVVPNAPRFLRHGDAITISSKIVNLSEGTLSGEAILQLVDAMTGKSIDGLLGNTSGTKNFRVDGKENTQVSWQLTIPENIDAVQYTIIAKSGNYSDGEQNVLPVLSNRMLVTETLPMWIRSNETKTFILDKLANSSTDASSTLKNHKLTLEMTSNPAWYAVQALPYLMEYPFDCNEQIFSRYYANALASHIATSNPRIKAVFDQWSTKDALLSNLEKNEDLKSILIQETPWLRDAQSESEQKQRIGLLFDVNKMQSELQSTLRKLENNQMENGAWAWFEGGNQNRFITQQIIAGFGHLKKLNADSPNANVSEAMIKKAIAYLDASFVQDYKYLRKYDKKVDLSKDHLTYIQLHYLYMRSFFPEIGKSKEVQDISAYYQTQIQKYWLQRPLYAKGLMAMISHQSKDDKTANAIIKSLKENSITSDELGMYWKENKPSWYWYQAPIETQALMIEVFSDIPNSDNTSNTIVDNLKVWLLKNKQTNSWNTTKATTEAVYALLMQGGDWLSVTESVAVKVGDKNIQPSQLEDTKLEAGTGYYKTSWTGSEIKPEMAKVTLTKKNEGIAWGSLYWQYFEDLDKITFAETPLQLKKKLFLKTNTDTGEQLSEINENTTLNVGDLVTVRIELRSDRDMEFLHMKDMRAAGFEPVNVLSSYKYQDGLGYYESTKDAATHFFFDNLPKGVYVFEYDLRVNNGGDMSNGITTIQSMYAPEFTSHSEGIRVKVK